MMNHTAEKKEQILIGEGQDFERIRRITGYLVGTMDRCQARRGARPGEAHPVQPVKS